MNERIKKIEPAIIVSRILRFGFGALIVVTGIIEREWLSIFIGALLFFTGFLRPRRCIDESCQIEQKDVTK